MNKKPLIFLLAAFTLAGCAKTNLLYGENAYNSPVFDENYYTEWEDIKSLDTKGSSEIVYYESKTTPGFFCSALTDSKEKMYVGGVEEKKYTWAGDKEKQFGYNNNLSKTEKQFSYGVTSKLFDGRVRC